MTDTAKLMELRKILGSGEDDADSILLSYLAQAGDIILHRMYPYGSEYVYEEFTVPAKYEMKQIRIAAYLLNKRGAEGQTMHIENGTHFRYKNADVPEEILFDVMPLVGIPR